MFVLGESMILSAFPATERRKNVATAEGCSETTGADTSPGNHDHVLNHGRVLEFTAVSCQKTSNEFSKEPVSWKFTTVSGQLAKSKIDGVLPTEDAVP